MAYSRELIQRHRDERETLADRHRDERRALARQHEREKEHEMIERGAAKEVARMRSNFKRVWNISRAGWQQIDDALAKLPTATEQAAYMKQYHEALMKENDRKLRESGLL